jgi:hypothetical protein
VSRGLISRSQAGFHRLLACVKGAGGAVVQTEPRTANAMFVIEGSIQARLGGTVVDVTLADTAAQARRIELASAGLAGGSWVAGVRLDRLLGRAGNVVVMYEQRPSARVTAAVARCTGEPVRLDEQVARRYGGVPAHTCTRRDRAVFAEFPQYGGASVTLGDDLADSSLGCSGELNAKARPGAALRYYRHQLRAHGWTLLPSSDEGVEGVVGQAGELTARRGSFGYAIAFEALGERPATTHLVIRVGNHG